MITDRGFHDGRVDPPFPPRVRGRVLIPLARILFSDLSSLLIAPLAGILLSDSLSLLQVKRLLLMQLLLVFRTPLLWEQW
ncbi:hypothetical protein MLD38_013607 [Melastoma candidum]|uniref:Uncharacterized protein n=1 Tax=Melastoma candidum TaxID=119954 RepID=A0ACB9RA39_9MYRT|nr:hypothetical protein MLD38_013607 [Melastoma candidum]